MRRASVLVVCAVALLAVASTPAGAATACKPGSGPDLTHRKLTQSYFSNEPNASCANLAGVDLSGFDLTQVDFAGANFQNANLENATMIQATVTGADFSNANLAHAKLVQARAQGANFSGADLTDADLTQADATDASFDHAKIGGTDFTQATLSGATFKGATGVTPYSLFLLIACAAIFVLLSIRPIRRLTSGGNASGAVWGIVGALVVAIGVHLFIGGILGLAVGGFGTPISQTCSTGVLCTIGVKSGFWGLWAGLFAILGGFFLRALGSGGQPSVRTNASYSG